MNVTQVKLEEGVDLIAVSTNKFKTSLFSVSLVVPLQEETATANALVGDVLYRGSEKYPDMEALSAATDDLYGTSLSPIVRQKGESQCISLIASMIDDRFSLDGTPILEGVTQLMGEILLHPATENGVFLKEYVESEGGNLADLIRSQINEKRGWSIHRVTEIMCQGEAYALDKYGSAEEAETMTPEALWERYQALLSEAKVVFYYGGAAEPALVEKAVRAAFAPLITPRPGTEPQCQVIASPKQEDVREETERMDVTQGKLALGFRTGGVDVNSEDYPALLVCNAIYGATASSKLFMNVREKLSLCYFAGSLLDKLKGLMVVSSGVEFANFQVARDEILLQLEHMRTGEFSDEDLVVGRNAVISSLRTLMDSQGRMEDFWFTQTIAGRLDSPEELMDRLMTVERDQVIAVAKKIQLDTIYYLTGEEA